MFVKSNVTVKSASEDSTSGSMGRNKTSFSALIPVQDGTEEWHAEGLWRHQSISDQELQSMGSIFLALELPGQGCH